MTVVYYEDEELKDSESTKVALRLLRAESKNPILILRDSDLAERLHMRKGKFYCYYKPSFINGFEQYLDKDINFDYL